MEVIKGVFSLAIIFALIGGLLGALLVIDHKRYGWVMTGLFIVLGMILSASVADFFFPPDKPWLYAGIGIFAGMTGTALLDAFKAAAPKLAGRVIDAVGNKAIDLLDGFKKRD